MATVTGAKLSNLPRTTKIGSGDFFYVAHNYNGSNLSSCSVQFSDLTDLISSAVNLGKYIRSDLTYPQEIRSKINLSSDITINGNIIQNTEITLSDDVRFVPTVKTLNRYVLKFIDPISEEDTQDQIDDSVNRNSISLTLKNNSLVSVNLPVSDETGLKSISSSQPFSYYITVDGKRVCEERYIVPVGLISKLLYVASGLTIMVQLENDREANLTIKSLRIY